MEILKVKVNSESEREETANLLEQLGGDLHQFGINRVGIVIFTNGVIYCDYTYQEKHYDSKYGCKEITIPQLRDLVILKRNDVSDATHFDSNNYEWYVASDEKHYRMQGDIWVHQPYVNCLDLKPIEKPMTETEYLMQGKNGERLMESVGQLKGMKYDNDKPRHSLLPKGTVNAVIDVLEFGAKKYEVNNWQKVDNAKERYYNAAMRHIDRWWNGEKHDPETNIHHLAHAATSLFFLIWFDENGE